MTLLLSGDEVRQALSETDVVGAIQDVSLQRSRGEVFVPPRITADAQDGQGWLRVGPALLNGSGYMGFKAMNRRPNLGVRYLVALYAIESGELLAFLDANSLTTARTAATNALGTHLLARDDAKVVGIVGSGVQARALVDHLTRLRDLERVVVTSPRAASREEFASLIRDRHGIAADAVDSTERVVQESDAVVLAFRAPTSPVFTSSMLRTGLHVTGLSSVRPEAREIDDETWTACNVVVIDDAGSVRQSGDGRSFAERGRSVDEWPELWQLVSGAVAGRENREDATLFKSSGNSEQDIAAAAAAYEKAREMGLGTDLGQFPEVKPYE